MGIVTAALVALAGAGILAVPHWYVWLRLVHDTTVARSFSRRFGTVAIWCGGLFMAGAIAARFTGAPFVAVRFVSWIGYLWAAVLVYLLLGVIAGEVARPLLIRLSVWWRRSATGRPGTAATPVAADPAPAQVDESALSRRLFVSRALASATAATAVATVGWGTYGVLKGPAVRHVTVPLRRLPASASGFRIALVSDLHLGPVLGAGFARMIVDTVNQTQPDLIAIAGDLVDATVAQIRADVAPLTALRAKHGTYFVTGNHEYYSGADEWISYLPGLGIQVLMNSHVVLPGFDLVGVDDLAGESAGRGPDLAAALRGRNPARPCVLLAHQPVLIHEAVRHGVDLVLSGHTHGGQMFPGNLLAALANPTVFGLEKYGESTLYVTRGAGAWGPPVRVGAPSDITVLELVAG